MSNNRDLLLLCYAFIVPLIDIVPATLFGEKVGWGLLSVLIFVVFRSSFSYIIAFNELYPDSQVLVYGSGIFIITLYCIIPFVFAMISSVDGLPFIIKVTFALIAISIRLIPVYFIEKNILKFKPIYKLQKSALNKTEDRIIPEE
jgi:hypothetical protein